MSNSLLIFGWPATRGFWRRRSGDRNAVFRGVAGAALRLVAAYNLSVYENQRPLMYRDRIVQILLAPRCPLANEFTSRDNCTLLARRLKSRSRTYMGVGLLKRLSGKGRLIK